MIVKPGDFNEKRSALSKTKLLKGTNLFVNEDFSQNGSEIRRKL